MSEEESTNHHFNLYLEMCERMVDSIVNNIDSSDFEKFAELQNVHRRDRNSMKTCLEQFKIFLRKELRVQ